MKTPSRMTLIEFIESLELHPFSDEQRKGVRKLLLFTSLIVILSVLLHLTVNFGLRRISTSSYGVSNRIADGSINADILISGSSRALSHYDPQAISEALGLNVYNIGLNGSQTDMQLARLKAYLKHNRPPRLLIQNLDIFSLQTTHGGVYDPAQYIPYLWDQDIYAALRKIYPPVWKSKFIPLYGYTVEDLRFTWVMGLRALAGHTPAEDHFLGFKPRDLSWTDDFEKLKAANPTGVHFEIEADGVKVMEELLALCRKQGIEVIMIYSPEFVGMQEITKDRSAAFAAFGELARVFGAEIWDYSSSPISGERRFFYNSQHLNREGAAQFSQDVAQRLRTVPSLQQFIGVAGRKT